MFDKFNFSVDYRYTLENLQFGITLEQNWNPVRKRTISYTKRWVICNREKHTLRKNTFQRWSFNNWNLYEHTVCESSEKKIIIITSHWFYFIKLFENSKRRKCLTANRKNIEKIICNGIYDIRFNNEIWNNVDTRVYVETSATLLCSGSTR